MQLRWLMAESPCTSSASRSEQRWLFLALLVAIALIAVIDYSTGIAVVVSALYFVPIIAAGWRLRRGPALAVAAIASGAWLMGNIVWRGVGDSISIRLLNAVAGTMTLAVVAALLRHARREHDGLLAANRQLDLALSREAETARTDALTGLPNARAFSEYVSRELARSRRSRAPLALLYVDLDDFKAVNDTHGHAAGDALLRRVGAVLQSVLRTGDIATRIGGDEFVVLLSDIGAQEAKQIAVRLVNAVHREASEYEEANAGASVGVAHFGRAGLPSAAEMLSLADAAMYEAKERGKNRVVMIPIVG